MKNLTIKNLTEVCSGIYHGPENIMDREVSSITTDSRKIEKDSLFVPIVGERVDAHRFIEDVMSKGALITLSERELKNADFPYIQITFFPSGCEGYRRILSETASDTGCRDYRKRGKDQYQRGDRVCSEGEIPHS